MGKLKYCLLMLMIPFIGLLNVNAATLEDKITFNPSISTIGGKKFDDINAYYILNAGQSETLSASLKFDIKDTTNLSVFPDEQKYYYMTLNYCTTGNASFIDIYSSYYNKIFDIVNTGVKCKASAGTDGDIYIMFVQMKLSFFDDDDSGAYAYRLYFQPSFGLKNDYGYPFYIRYLDARILSYDDFLKNYKEYDSISKQVEIINKNQELIEKQNETNNKLDEAENTRKGIWETIKSIPGLILDGFKSLFIPEDMSFLDDFKETISNKLGFIAQIPIAVIDFGIDLVNLDVEEMTSVTFPTVEIMGVHFWPELIIDISPILSKFSSFKYLTDVLCVSLCVYTLDRWREKFTGGGETK